MPLTVERMLSKREDFEKQGIFSDLCLVGRGLCRPQSGWREARGKSMPDIRESTSSWLDKLVHVYELSHIKIPTCPGE